MYLSRRSFLLTSLGSLAFSMKKPQVMTINGWIDASKMGKTLIHEHFLVDFIGADKTNANRWDKEKVITKVLSYLLEVKALGINTIFDCTPNFLGRDVELLKLLAQKSGLQILTNTGYYGAMYNKFLPQWAHTETAEQLAERWIKEFKNGIDDTKVKPGFIKIGVDSGKTLTEIHQKLVKAAGLTHLATGLTICSHTGPAHIAFEEIEILRNIGISSSAFVWVHAQSESNKAEHTKAARMGTWVSLDGIGWGNSQAYAESIDLMKSNGVLNRLLISHDSGWYKPDEPDSNDFKGYTNIFKELMPMLKQKGFTDADFEQILVRNPAEAFAIRVRKA